MAKNQMLALNIPKLGHCGKLICCLKYEDDVYTLEKIIFKSWYEIKLPRSII